MMADFELFALEDDSTCCSTDSDSSDEDTVYDSLDECLDAYNLAEYIRSQNNPAKRQHIGYADKDLRPAVFVRLNIGLGTPEAKTILCLVDSGSSGTLIAEKHTKKLRVRQSNNKPTVWSTPAGEMTTRDKTKLQFTMPELHDKRLIEWNCHVVEEMGDYDMIIGRDLLEFLQIDIVQICFYQFVQQKNSVITFFISFGELILQ